MNNIIKYQYFNYMVLWEVQGALNVLSLVAIIGKLAQKTDLAALPVYRPFTCSQSQSCNTLNHNCFAKI